MDENLRCAFVVVVTGIVGCGAPSQRRNVSEPQPPVPIEQSRFNNPLEDPESLPTIAFFVGRAPAYVYAYPHSRSSVEVEPDKPDKPRAIRFELDASTNAGGAIGFDVAVDAAFHHKEGTLRFQVRGSGQIASVEVALVDDDLRDGAKVESRVRLANYVKVTEVWQDVVIPLTQFPSVGSYWNGRKVVSGRPFAWEEIREFKVSLSPGKGTDSWTSLSFANVRIEP